MFEIEVKAKISDTKTIIEKLESLGCKLSDPVRQEDEIFNISGATPSNLGGGAVMRIRNSNGKYILTAKKDRSGELDCLEQEVEVNDPVEARKMLELLGFAHTVFVNKNRRKGKIGDLEICLDEVEGLGSFIEAEKISDEDGKKVQAELMEFLISLGVKPEDRVFEGYDTMMYKKEHGRK